jgi:hypothetical protein
MSFYLHSSSSPLIAGARRLCPRCRADMSNASLSLEALIAAWPLSRMLHREQGVALDDGTALSLECPGCHAPSLLRIAGDVVYLIPAVTFADTEYLRRRHG